MWTIALIAAITLLIFFVVKYDSASAFLVLVIITVTSCNQSNWWQESEKARDKANAEQAAKESVPRYVSEAYGCKVYTFKGGDRWQYFTRCGDTTSTDTTYKESCGKNCSKTIVNTITTTNTKEK